MSDVVVQQIAEEQARHGLRFNAVERRHECICGEWCDSGQGGSGYIPDSRLT